MEERVEPGQVDQSAVEVEDDEVRHNDCDVPGPKIVAK
jgi:hypothetical protein